MRLFVGGLNYKTTEQGLRDFFEEDYAVEHAQVVTDRVTGLSKGFGFVDIVTNKSEAEVIEAYQSAQIDGRNVTVNRAHPKPTRENGGRGHGHDDRRGGGGDRDGRERRHASSRY